MAYKRTELRDCDFCQKEQPHEVKRLERVQWSEDPDAVPIVRNQVTCLCCDATRIEKRIIVAR